MLHSIIIIIIIIKTGKKSSMIFDELRLFSRVKLLSESICATMSLVKWLMIHAFLPCFRLISIGIAWNKASFAVMSNESAAFHLTSSIVSAWISCCGRIFGTKRIPKVSKKPKILSSQTLIYAFGIEMPSTHTHPRPCNAQPRRVACVSNIDWYGCVSHDERNVIICICQ